MEHVWFAVLFVKKDDGAAKGLEELSPLVMMEDSGRMGIVE